MLYGIRAMCGGTGLFDKNGKQIGFAGMPLSEFLRFSGLRVIDTSGSFAVVL